MRRRGHWWQDSALTRLTHWRLWHIVSPRHARFGSWCRPVMTPALIERLRSRDQNSFSDRLLAALRNEFGGHEVKKQP
jgi:hypothetical protein